MTVRKHFSLLKTIKTKQNSKRVWYGMVWYGTWVSYGTTCNGVVWYDSINDYI